MPRRFLAAVLLVVLAACSSAPAESHGSPNDMSKGSSPNAPAGKDDGSGRNDGAENDDVVGVLTVIATGLRGPSELVVHAGTAYVATMDALMKVSPAGEVEKLDEYASRIGADEKTLVWSSSRGLTSAPFADLLTRTIISSERVTSLAVHDGRAFFTVDSSDVGNGAPDGGSVLQAEIGKAATTRPVTTNAALNNPEIAADTTHVFFFASPNLNETEVRRVRATGGESEPIGFLAGDGGRFMARTDSTVFFTSDEGGLYALPKAGGLAARHVFDGYAPVANASGVYFLATAGKIVQIHHVDAKGENRRLVAQHYDDTNLRLAVDETGLYAVSVESGALYKVSKE